MTSQTRRERPQLGQFTLTANAQGHRLRAAERTARSGVAPTASRAAPQAHAPSPVKTTRNACEVSIVPNRIASLRFIAPSVSQLFDHLILPQWHRLRDSSGRAPERAIRLTGAYLVAAGLYANCRTIFSVGSLKSAGSGGNRLAAVATPRRVWVWEGGSA